MDYKKLVIAGILSAALLSNNANYTSGIDNADFYSKMIDDEMEGLTHEQKVDIISEIIKNGLDWNDKVEF